MIRLGAMAGGPKGGQHRGAARPTGWRGVEDAGEPHAFRRKPRQVGRANVGRRRRAPKRAVRGRPTCRRSDSDERACAWLRNGPVARPAPRAPNILRDSRRGILFMDYINHRASELVASAGELGLASLPRRARSWASKTLTAASCRFDRLSSCCHANETADSPRGFSPLAARIIENGQRASSASVPAAAAS